MDTNNDMNTKYFEFSDIGINSLSLEFKCSKCGLNTITGNIRIPKVEIDFSNLYAKSEVHHIHQCKCNNAFNILLSCDLYNNRGYVLDENINECINCIIHEIPDSPYDQYEVFIDTLDNLRRIRLVASNISLYKEHVDYINRLLIINLVTIMDTFIKVSVEPIILMHDEIVDRYINIFCKNKKEISSKQKKDAIISHLQSSSFQTKVNQTKLFKEVLKVDIEMTDDIERYVKVRDILIHRNGINHNGSICNFSREAVLKATELFEDYIFNVIYRRLDSVSREIEIQRYLENNKE